jgi:hypothetical protein
MTDRSRAAWTLFLIAFVYYLSGVYPAVSPGDSGEFITAGSTLGIPHAPGYPTYVILARLARTLLPWANFAYRINLLSSLCAAGAVMLVFWLSGRLALSVQAGICSALVFMVGHAHMVSAQASEVFALHVLFCAGIITAALDGKWLLTAFLMGLAIGNHQTILLLAPALALAYIARPPDVRVSPVAVALCLAAGLSIYGVLWIRAAHDPGLNAGNPRTLEALWRVFIRADYGSLTLALGETPERNAYTTLLQLGRFFRGMADQVGWAGIAIGLVGIYVGLRRFFVITLLLTVAFGCLGPLFFLLGNLPFDAQSTGLLERFYIAPTLCWTLLIAVGIHSLSMRRPQLGWLAFLLPLALLIQTAKAAPFEFRRDFRAYAYGRNNLRTLPPGAMFIMDGGDDTFYTLAYLTQVETRRQDIGLHDRGGVVFPGFYGGDFRSLPRDKKEPRRLQVEGLTRSSGQPLFYSTMNEHVMPDTPQVQKGILYQLAPDGAGGAIPDFWSIYDLRGIAPWTAPHGRPPTDYRMRALVPFYPYQRSVESGRAERWEEALSYASVADSIGPDVLWLVPNLVHNAYLWGQKIFQSGDLALVRRIYQTILAWDPRESTAWSNLGAIEERAGRLDAAIADYRQAIEIEPSSEAAHYNLAVAYWKRSEWENVVEELKHVLTMNPRNEAARTFLAQAEARLNEKR